MGKARDISNEKKVEIQALLRHSSMTMAEIARTSDVSERTVSRLRDTITRDEPPVTRRQNCGRKRAISPRGMRILTRSAKMSPSRSASQHAQDLSTHGINVSKWTVQRSLRETGFKSVHPTKKPLLTPAMKRKRLLWAKNHRNWTVEEWRKVRKCCIELGCLLRA